MSESCKVLEVAPVLRVSDAQRSAEWYRDRLGFSIDFLWPEASDTEPPRYAIIRRGEATLHLSRAEGSTAMTSMAYVFVSDVDALAAELEQRGTAVDEGPRTLDYGMREIDLRDPDGNGLTFGQGAVELEAGV